MHQVRFFSSRFQLLTRNRKNRSPKNKNRTEPVGSEMKPNGTDWIRNETVWNRLDPKWSRTRLEKLESRTELDLEFWSRNRKKTGTELNFRFIFLSFFHSIFNLCDCERRGDVKPQNQPPLKIEFFNLPIVNPMFSSRLLFELDYHSIFWLWTVDSKLVCVYTL